MGCLDVMCVHWRWDIIMFLDPFDDHSRRWLACTLLSVPVAAVNGVLAKPCFSFTLCGVLARRLLTCAAGCQSLSPCGLLLRQSSLCLCHDLLFLLSVSFSDSCFLLVREMVIWVRGQPCRPLQISSLLITSVMTAFPPSTFWYLQFYSTALML